MIRRICSAITAILLLTLAPAYAQEFRSGVGVDGRGNAVVDPTENVKALNAAEAKRQDDLRTMEAKFQNAMRDAETRRINELASQKQLFDLELARVLRANVDSAALLLSTQLKEVKTDLSDRTAKLEQFRWETGGRGAGIGDAYGYVVGVVGIMIALASFFWKRT
jgi:hypothetical protein